MGTEREALLAKIKKLKEKRNACILAHNFQSYEVQEAADFVGGTKEIYAEALERGEENILVASVYPMARVVACLVPEKSVLSPDPNAGCPMIGMLDIEGVRAFKEKHPETEILCYVKASPEAIALSSYCLGFNDALELLGNTKREDTLLIPDMHIAKNVSSKTGRPVTSKGGYCPPHVKILPRDVDEMRKQSPEAIVLAHPECRGEVAEAADAVLESEDIVKYVHESDKKSFIVASEVSLVERLSRENPDKEILPASSRAFCQSMKRITLEKIYWTLEDMAHSIEADEEYGARVRELVRKLYKGWQPMA